MNEMSRLELAGWSICNVDIGEYARYSTAMHNAFNRAEFLRLNIGKVDELHCLVISKGNSARFAVSFGMNAHSMRCPFSASFGYIEDIKGGQSIENYEYALRLIDEYMNMLMPDKVEITLPPSFYRQSEISTWAFLLDLYGWRAERTDLDYAFRIPEIISDYENVIAHNARKNLRISMQNGFELKKCESLDEKKEAYRIIKLNRDSKGYNLAMTEQEVLDTIKVVDADMYLLHADGINYASALVYEVSPKIGLVVYWGDIPDVGDKKVMNYLPYALLNEYHSRGFEYLDIGTSTLNGRPNYGLSNYKDSIGCVKTIKLTFSKSYSKQVD